MSRQRATIMVCDNPDCRNAEVTSKSEPALGYYFGKGFWALAYGGGPISAVYACSEECIAPAIMHAIET